MDGICLMYEQALKLNLANDGGARSAQYGYQDLTQFIDGLQDMMVLTMNDSGFYVPHNKAWVKRG